MMSVSSTLDSSYCSGTTSDAVPLDSDDAVSYVNLWGSDDESYLSSLLQSELVDQVHEIIKTKSLGQLRKKTWLMNSREEAINWILKVHAYYGFRPETAYLSISYLDRFLFSSTLTQYKGWPHQLLSVSCLALAAKLKELKVPLLMDLQMIEPRFVFKPATVQRMELMVMASLKWRMHITTPFDFVHLFIAKLSCSVSILDSLNAVVSRVSDVITSTCLVMDFLKFLPSTIAAAALLLVTNQCVGDKKLCFFHKNLNMEMLQKCYNLMKQRKQITRGAEHILTKNAELLPTSPTCVLHHATAMQESSDGHVP